MIPNQYHSPHSTIELPQSIPENQPMQIPKIDHIIAHAKHPEFSYIYARPELQASASANVPQALTPSQDASTPKKGRPREKKHADGEKKTKTRKNEIYDKYYIDTSARKKNAPIKKIDLWEKDAWEDILKRKNKYFEFCKLTGELTSFKSDDEEGLEKENSSEGEGEVEREGEDNVENLGGEGVSNSKEENEEREEVEELKEAIELNQKEDMHVENYDQQNQKDERIEIGQEHEVENKEKESGENEIQEEPERILDGSQFLANYGGEQEHEKMQVEENNQYMDSNNA